MIKHYKISIMEINSNDNYQLEEFREIKEKYLCYEGQNEEYIFNKFIEHLPLMLELLKNDKIEWQKVVSAYDKKKCY